MTDYERVALEKVSAYFTQQFNSLVGDCLAQMPYPLQPETLEHIQTLTNVYDSHDKHLEIKRTNWGTLPTEVVPDFLSIAPPT